MHPTQRVADALRSACAESTGLELASRIGALLAEDAEATAWTGGDDTWFGRDEILESWLRPEMERHPGYRKDVGPVWVSASHIAMFQVVSSEPPVGNTAQWLGLDVFRVRDGSIVHAAFYNDTFARAALDRAVDPLPMWKAIDARWSSTTTAANRVGMKQIQEIKSVVRPARACYDDLMAMFEPDIDLWSWEADRLLHLAGRDTVNGEFIEPLFPLMPDFYEAVGDCVVFGNALVMPQCPSGTFEGANGRRTFSAWYNCDIYVFREHRVQSLYFARDTLKDEQQMKAAFEGTRPLASSSLHMTGVGMVSESEEGS